MKPRRHVLLLLLLVALGAAGTASLQSEIFGLHHDDGVYLTSAESLAAGAGYRLPSVPGAPAATKYPPLYPLLASLVIVMAPPFPGNLLLLKLVNVACYVVALALFFGLARRRLDDDHAALALTASLGLSPIVVLYLDYTMTESLFLALTIAFLIVWERAVAKPGASPSRTLAVVIVLLAILATKAIGFAIGLAAFLDALRRRRWSLALPTAAVTVTWTIGWQCIQPADVVSPLLDYYLRYEPTILPLVSSNPLRAADTMIDTLRHYSDGLHMVVGPAWSLAPLVGLAAYGLFRQRHTIEPLLVFGCLGILLVYPGAAPRYLLPLLPVYLLAAGGAARAICSRAGFHRLTLPVAVTVIAIAGVMPIANYVMHHPRELMSKQRWQALLDAARWLRDNTAEGTVVASGYDQAYFLASRRPTVRPWRHDAFSYFHPYGNAVPQIGTATQVRADLAALGVRYVIVEPQDFHIEGEAVEALLKAIVELPPLATPVFTNDDGRRVIYRLP